jgi:hypothetical protein
MYGGRGADELSNRNCLTDEQKSPAEAWSAPRRLFFMLTTWLFLHDINKINNDGIMAATLLMIS